MDEIKRMLIERECARLVTNYCLFVDSRQYDRFLDVFTEDGVMGRGPKSPGFNGRKEIEAYLKVRRTDIYLKHVSANVIIDVIDENNATGMSYFTVYRKEGYVPGETIQPTAPAIVGEYRDRFVRDSDGKWRIKQRDATPYFGEMKGSAGK